ncbi:MAG: hypothetical protein ACRBBN_16885 [Methyloligellaceae bacterium]
MSQSGEIQSDEKGSGIFNKIIGALLLLEFFVLPVGLAFIVMITITNSITLNRPEMAGLVFVAFLLFSFLQWYAFGWRMTRIIFSLLFSSIYGLIAYSFAAKATGDYALARIVEIQEVELTIIYPEEQSALAITVGIGAIFFLISLWLRNRQWS